jgi:hypothetical protein
MGKIIFSMIISIVGIMLFFAGQNTSKYIDNSDPIKMQIGGLFQFIALIVFIVGLKDYFLSDILEEIKKLTTDKMRVNAQPGVEEKPKEPTAEARQQEEARLLQP